MMELIDKKQLLKDLAGMYDVMTGAGDPFLASMIRMAMECVDRQPSVQCSDEPEGLDPEGGIPEEAICRLKAFYEKAQTLDYVYNKIG
jgi:hypothetical protein